MIVSEKPLHEQLIEMVKLLDRKKEPLKKLYGVFEVNGKILYYDTRSLYIFNQDNRFRKAIV